MADQLGEYLKSLRGKESLRSVADRTHGKISHSYISDLEKGFSRRGNKIKPSPDTLKILSEVYSADYDYLMSLAGYYDEKESDNTNKQSVDIDDDNVIMTYEGKPIPPEDLEVIKRFLFGGKRRGE